MPIGTSGAFYRIDPGTWSRSTAGHLSASFPSVVAHFDFDFARIGALAAPLGQNETRDVGPQLCEMLGNRSRRGKHVGVEFGADVLKNHRKADPGRYDAGVISDTFHFDSNKIVGEQQPS